MSSVTTPGARGSSMSFGRIWDQYGMLVESAGLFFLQLRKMVVGKQK